MRFLLSFAGGRGHFDPLAPFAGALAAAGHAVAVAAPETMRSAIASLGFETLALGLESPALRPPKRTALRPVDPRREDEEFRERFARRAARLRAPALRALCERWRPDALVCDETDFGAMIAAEASGRPHASVLVMAAGSFVRPALVAEPLAELRAAHGLAPDPELRMLRRHLVLTRLPPRFRDPGYPLPENAHAFRPPGLTAPTPREPPAWTRVRPGAPCVYFTLGTVFNLESGDLFERALAGLAALDANVLVTVGTGVDPAELGTQPPHLCIERFVAQAEVLPWCDLVISHGGSGSVGGALACGVPSVLLPMGADQPHNAARCEALGVGVALDVVEMRPEDLRDAARRVLADPAFRTAAQGFRDDLAALPEATAAVPLLEGLARPA